MKIESSTCKSLKLNKFRMVQNKYRTQCQWIFSQFNNYYEFTGVGQYNIAKKASRHDGPQ